MKKALDLKLMEEFTNLESFIIKAPAFSQEFWKEWQEKYSRALISKIAIKKILRTDRLTTEEIKRYRGLLDMYEGLIAYFENLKRLALSLRGVYEHSESPGFDDEDIDFDF
ncbi:MAG: hypothetical protein ACK4OF_04450 [Aquificaceae bacterium]